MHADAGPTYLALIEDLVTSLAEAGFRRIVFVNGHYTNYPAINLACFNASHSLSEGVRAWALSYWDALPAEEAEEYLSLTSGLHANIGETSAVMAVSPDLVKLDRAVAGWPRFPELKGPPMPTIFAYFETNMGSTYRALPYGVMIHPETGIHPIPWPYSHGIRIGNMLFIAGQVSLDEELRLVGPGDAEEQARQTWTNIQKVVEAAGGKITDVVRVCTYLADLAHMEAVHKVRREFFPDGNDLLPARVDRLGRGLEGRPGPRSGAPPGSGVRTSCGCAGAR